MHAINRPPEPEKGFQRAIIDLAKASGWRVYFTWRSIHSPAGFPDLTLVKPPHLIFAEVKSARGRVTNDQWEWLYALAGCQQVEVYVWKPENWPEIEERLTREVP